MPTGSVESLRLSYKTGLKHLVRGYTTYLHRNIQETAAPGPQNFKTRMARGPTQTNTTTTANMICSSNNTFSVSLVSPNISTNKLNEIAAPNSAAEISKTNESNEDFGLNVQKGSNETTVDTVNRKTLNGSAGHSAEEEASVLGLLVIEPWRNVSHNVQHHPCESPAIQQALVTRIINAQDMERNTNFFLYPEKVFRSLLRQKDDFELKTD